MTAVCGGGTSGPKPGSELSVSLGSAYMAQLLELAEIPWLWPIIPLLVVPPLALNIFCASDPPAYPTFTQAEATSLTQLDISNSVFPGALGKAVQLMQYLAWYDNCHCTSGTLTPPTTGTPPPSGTTVVINPSPQQTAPCYQTNLFTSVPSGYTNDGVAVAPQAMPVGASQVQVQYNFAAATGGAQAYDVYFYPLVNGATDQAAKTTTVHYTGAALQVTTTDPLPVGTTGMRYVFANNTGPGSSSLNAEESYYCGGAGPGVQTPCCPPDGTTQATLDAILRLVTLTQRQIAPFGYIEGSTFSGLTGNGILSVQGLLGVKILPSSIPPDAGVAIGDPDTLWLDSWINWGNADGWLAREFLRASPHVSLPPLAGQFTSLGYSIRPGMSVSVTELLREP